MVRRARKTSYWQDAPMPRDQLVIFSTTLEERIPEDHPVRVLDEILERLEWSDWEAEYNGHIGQPPIHPRILAGVLLFAMMRRIRSSRQIEYHLIHSIDFIWLASGRTIDHNTISNFRRKYGEQIKGIYRQIIRLAVDMGVAKLSELCIDGTRVLANANRYKTWTAERVSKVIAALDQEIEEALGKMELIDNADDLLDDGVPADKLPAPVADMQQRREQLDQLLAQLNAMDDQRRAIGTDPQKSPAQIPKTDQDARILPSKEGGYAANYTPMIVAETAGGFIVGADVVIGNVESTQLWPMCDEIIADYEADVETVMGDTAYSAGENLSGAEERGIELLAPLSEPKCPENPAIRDDPSQPVAQEKLDQLPINPTTKRFDKSAFIYDEQEDCYYCPAGEKLPRTGNETKTRGTKKTLQAVYTSSACEGCAMASQCRKDPEAKKGRRITHDVHEPARRRHRERMGSPENRERFKVRQHIGETPFAVIKAVMDMRRFLLRGIDGVQIEWLWGCTAFNLKKLVHLTATMRLESTETELMPIG